MGAAEGQQGIHFGATRSSPRSCDAARVQGGVRARVKGWAKWLLFQTGAHRALQHRPGGPAATSSPTTRWSTGGRAVRVLALDVPAFSDT
jgi:hypothetical protein